MDKTWMIIIGILLFLIITFLYWKVTKGYVERVYGKKMWQHWGARTFYWAGALFISGGITVLVLLLFK